MEKKIKIIDLLNKIANGETFENCKLKFKEIEPEEVNEYVIYDRLYEEDLNLNDEVEILDEEKEIEIPQEFLKDVNPESEIVLIKDDIGHDYGYKNSIGFITNRTSYENSCYIFGFDKRANRWWECGFNEDDYIRTGLFVSDLFKPFVILTPSKEDEFEDITSWGKPALEELKTKDIKLRDLQSYIYIVALSQNELIKNQKKIIERLKDE